MVARSFACDPSRLRPLLEDRLDEEEQAALARHLETCTSCRTSLEQMAAESRWWGDARLLAGESITQPPTPADLDSPPTGAGPWPDLLGFLEPTTERGQLGKLGPYEVSDVIGRGGMGVVLKAFDRSLGRFVAIKVLAPELATSATARRRFAREAQAAAAISHDHIVAIHAVDQTPGALPYLVMQYVSGRSLQERLDRTGPLDLRAILRIGMQAASGLAAAHAVGLVHRDVKPANILLENCVERVKLTDFGLARAADDASLTQSGVVAGTPQYMAPEQARGEPVDARADLFSLGSVLYALCTGRPPFRAETTMGVLRRVCDDTPRPIRELNPEIPDWLQAIIARLQAKDPACRFASAAEVAELLGRCLDFLEHPDQPPPYVADRVLPPRRKARVGIVASLVVLTFTGVGAAARTDVAEVANQLAVLLRIKTAEGTLVIQVDDPEVHVRVDGEDVVFTGAGQREIRLSVRPGQHRVEKTKGDKVTQEVVTITRGDKVTVRATFESDPTAAAADAGVRERGARELREAETQVANGSPAVAEHSARASDAETIEQLKARIKALEQALQSRVQTDREEQLQEQINRARVPIGTHQVPMLTESIEERLSRARNQLFKIVPRVRNQSDPTIVHLRNEIATLEAAIVSSPLAASPFGTGRSVGATPVVATFELMPEVLRPIATPTQVQTLAVSSDGKTLAAGCRDGSIRVWELPSRKLKNMFVGRGTGVRSIAFSPDCKMLASAGGNDERRDEPGEAKLWDLAEGRVRYELNGHTGLVFSITFSPDGATIATGSWDNTARLWDASTGQTRAVLEGHTAAIHSVAFSASTVQKHIDDSSSPSCPYDTIATGSLDGDVRFWHNAPGQAHDGKQWASYHASDLGVGCIAYSPGDGRTLAISRFLMNDRQQSNEVILLDTAQWKERGRLSATRHAILTLAFSPNGNTLASGGGISGEGGGLCLWDVAAARHKFRITGLDCSINAAAFSRDGKCLIIAGGISDNRGEVRFWGLAQPSRQPGQPRGPETVPFGAPARR